jgi:hypothetical protein
MLTGEIGSTLFLCKLYALHAFSYVAEVVS